ncbi:hypothetical protein J2744_001802 [Halorubrum trapanicum]|uniref:Uncharacterized protein n=1 Tax=Halorubrum trapanicum TaxID=29284 RepID=A0A8J7UMH2_9EURY|nr:hypothetical protein [Halorubrum trapanicum]MBP1902119.1 hypothetical protein [Halorubrum trapanicum]
MLNKVGKYLYQASDPDPRALKIVAVSSAFILFLFASDPLPGNRYYVVGLLLTTLALAAAILLLFAK